MINLEKYKNEPEFQTALKEMFSSRGSRGDISMCVQKNTLHKK